MQRVLRSGTLPPAGGSPVTILATTTITELQAALGFTPIGAAAIGNAATGQPITGMAVTGHGDPISVAELLTMAGDADLIPVVLSDTGGVLAYGRTRRLASRGQRLALAARDGGCCFPSCDRPAAWTEVHHVRPWLPDGATDLDNMCLLCRYHHREFANNDWQVLMIDAIPHWRPPTWLDPDQHLIRNTAHHQRDFDFNPRGCDPDLDPDVDPDPNNPDHDVGRPTT